MEVREAGGEEASAQDGNCNVIKWSITGIIVAAGSTLITFVVKAFKKARKYAPDIAQQIAQQSLPSKAPQPTTQRQPSRTSVSQPRTQSPAQRRLPVDLPQLCAWMDLPPTTCQTETEARPPSVTATGSIPSEIGQLTGLTYLVLSRNALLGTIPTQIGLLTSLTYYCLTNLDLSTNALTGSIPSQIGLLMNLTHLDLFNNTLIGSIPSHFGQLMSLTLLDLHNNALTAGTIPSSFCNGGGTAYIDCEKITTCDCCYGDFGFGGNQELCP